jgi:molybdopterin/thiamine biosynthesis adenylyltransferase
MSDLRNERILIVGLGGLGVPAALGLVRGGAKELALIDPDPVELSNLPRQIIYGDTDCGELKVVAAARRLSAIAPATHLTPHPFALDAVNAPELIRGSAFVIDATDNPAIKFLINDTCVAVGTPFAYGGVLGMTGQAMTVIPRRTACLRCLFEEPPGEDEIASCRDAGIIGPVAGAIGEAQAADALRWLRGSMPALAGKMLTYDGKLGRARLADITARSGCACGAASEATHASSMRTS